MSLTQQRAAFFDVDNTLVRGSTIYFLGRGNRFQKSAQDFIGGHNVTEINAVAQEIYDEYVSPALWEGTIEIAQRHLNDGVEVWLVTAAPEDMATLIAERLGFTGALGSKAAIKDGFYTGEMNGPLLHGREKATAIKELARERGFDLEHCFGYSDSHNDLPLLLTVGNPSAINPDAILRIRALKEKWPINDFRRMRFVNRLLGPMVSRAAWLGTRLTPRRKSR